MWNGDMEYQWKTPEGKDQRIKQNEQKQNENLLKWMSADRQFSIFFFSCK